jgi:hypothetical protein
MRTHHSLSGYKIHKRRWVAVITTFIVCVTNANLLNLAFPKVANTAGEPIDGGWSIWSCNTGGSIISGGAVTVSQGTSRSFTITPNTCAPLQTTRGEVIHVSNVSELTSAVAKANSEGGNKTILIADGTYNLNNGLWLSAGNLVIRSASGNRNAVVLKGKGMNGSVSHVFGVAASNIIIADMTIGDVATHAIQVHGEDPYNADNLLVHNVRIVNTNEQMLKGSFRSSKPDYGSDNGIVECSLFEFPSGQASQSYTGGIDVHNGKNWIVRDNIFKGIRSPGGSLAEYAIHFWSNSANTLVERNTIINCDRGIGFGLDNQHRGGIIRNNMIYNNGKGTYNDVGIGLWHAIGVKVYNNTIYQEQSYPYAIEYRFSDTKADICNNLTNKAIAQRDGGKATLRNNVINAQKSWFKAPTTGDLHLASKVRAVVDQGKTLSDVIDDIDKETRPRGSGYDIGADEYTKGQTNYQPPSTQFLIFIANRIE